MILDKVKDYALAGIAAVVVALGLYAWVLSARLDAVKAQLQTCKGNTDRLQSSIDAQNIAIRKLGDEAAKAMDQARDARVEAEKQASQHDLKAAELRKWQRAAGENECAAAKRLLSEVRR